MSADSWSPMSEDEAIGWCRAWQIETDVSSFARWTPKVETESDEIRGHLNKAIELVWTEIKRLRPPCLSHMCEGRPSIWLTSIPVGNPVGNYSPAEPDRASIVEYHFSIHNPPELPSAIGFKDNTDPLVVIGYDSTKWKVPLILEQLQSRVESYFVHYVMSQIDFRVMEGVQFCGGAWISESRKREKSPRCPVCGDFGTGFGQIRNERRFFHERNRSCYVGVVEPKQKHNPVVKCPKCGEMGTAQRGKDGYLRIWHAETHRLCHAGRIKDL